MKYLVTYKLVPTELHVENNHMVQSVGVEYTTVVETSFEGNLEGWFHRKSAAELYNNKTLIVLMVHKL